ncbi:hypothetical protein N0V90_000662 [Kalmusia sp. IMI 367209]|nr:hypothetical protein N0V90_000662 [Kalmusia sp. IMI 367209]
MDPSSPLDTIICARLRAQKPNVQARKTTNTFIRNLEEALDVRRATQTLFPIIQNAWQADPTIVNFCSNDVLSIGASGALRNEFMSELAKQPDFSPGSGGSRVLDGNFPYLEETEQFIAGFHGAETGLIMQSGFDANVAIWTAIPRIGDVILYDELVHASTHEGLSQSLAMARHEFAHNDIESFRSAILVILDKYPAVKSGRRCILVAVEGTYSVDGDMCPLQELVDVSRELFPENPSTVQFVIDEAHSTGVIGPMGKGLVNALGLEQDIAVRLHTCGKAMSASGAIILGSATVRAAIINLTRSVIFSTGPSFPFVAAIRAGYNLLQTGQTTKVIRTKPNTLEMHPINLRQAQDRVQDHVRLFFESIIAHPLWPQAQSTCRLSIPLLDLAWRDQPYVTHIVPIHTQEPYHYWLYFHLLYSGFSVFPVSYPTVPSHKTRLKVTFHADNTTEEVLRLVDAMFDFVQEVVELETGNWDTTVPQKAKRVYAWMEKEGLVGYGKT